MKRTVCVCIIVGLCAFAAGAAQAQSSVAWGIKAGAGFANVNGADWGDSDPLIGLSGGLYADIPVSGSFSIQPELLVTIKGAKASYEPFYLAEEKDTLVYLEAPVLAKSTLTAGGQVDLSLYGGPSFGLLLSACYELTGPEASLAASALGVPVEGNLEDIGGQMSQFELGLVFGGGVKYRLARGSLVFDLRYSLGLTNIMDMTPEVDAKNGVFLAMTGYEF